MFQAVKQMQSRSPAKSGPSGLSPSTAKSFRDNIKVSGIVTMTGPGTRSLPIHNDVEQPSCWTLTKLHLRRELWSYLGLLGLFSIYFGILVCVYAFKGVFAQRGVMTFCGVFLNGLGGMNLFISWMCYRCQKKHRKFSTCCFGGEADHEPPPPSPKPPKTRPRGQSLAGFLTPEFAKFSEFSARDRRYENKRPHHLFKAYDPGQISISFAHKYWLEQQKPLLQSGIGNPSLFPSSFPASPQNLRRPPPTTPVPQSSETKRRLLEKNQLAKRRQLST